MSQHLIFEGAELSGKSWLMAQVYDYLEPKYNRNRVTLDGCHWFNCDVGVYGTEHGQVVIGKYLEIFTELKKKNLIVEKLHLSDMVYSELHRGAEVDYTLLERQLSALDFKIVLLTFPRDEAILRQRIKDRLRLYPHYERILQSPGWYLEQQDKYLEHVQSSRLPYLILESSSLPDFGMVEAVLHWIGEK